MQKTLRQHYYLSTSPSHLTPYTEGRWSKFFLPTVFPKETITPLMILYKIVKVRSPDGDTDYFDIVASVLQEDKFAPYLFIICLDYVLRTSIDLMKENIFKLAKERSRRYPAQTVMDTDYSDEIVLLANSPPQAKSLQQVA